MIIMDDGIRLNAKLELPEEKKDRMPVAVMIHGFTGHIEEEHIIAVSKALNRLGVATLRADMYGHGNSEGEFRKHTLFKWMTNALTLIDYARGLDFATDIYLCGHSQGGLTAMLAAGMKREQIKGLIPLSPAWMIPEGARKGTLLGKDFDPKQVPDSLVSWDGRTLDGNYVRVAQTIHVEEYIDQYEGPVLIVHGTEDEAVPVHYGIEAAKRYRDAELVLIEGDDHCYTRHLDQAVAAVEGWMKKQLDKG